MKNLKSIVFFLIFGLLAATAFVICSSAADHGGSCGTNVNWSLDTETGEFNITGSGEMTDYISYSSHVAWYNYRDSIRSLVVEDGVTSIGGAAFKGFAELKSITVPASVALIGEYAFYGSTGIDKVYYGGSEAAWDVLRQNIAEGNELLLAADIIFARSADDTSAAATENTAAATETAVNREFGCVSSFGTGGILAIAVLGSGFAAFKKRRVVSEK